MKAFGCSAMILETSDVIGQDHFCSQFPTHKVGVAKVPNHHRLPMIRNVEIKARVPDLAALRKRVVEMSTSGPELLVQRDTFYTVLQGRLKLREFGDGTAELIYYERPDQ